MARQKGTSNLAASLEVLAGAPLDARTKVPLKADLTASGTFPYHYEGLTVYVVEEQKSYVLTGNNPTVAANWKEVGGGSEVTIDDEIDDTSENPVQNKVIAAALNDKADLVDSKVPAAQLPSFVDDVLEYEDQAHFPASGESGKIYVALDTNKTYRWSGSAYVEISESLALGETSSTAYRGDRGKTAYDDSQANKAAIGDLSELETTDKTDLVSAINEVAGSSGGGSYTAGDGIVIENDEISTDNMSAEDMSEVASPMPSVMSRRFKYSTEEQVVGEWIDGKPIYQLTLENTYSQQSSAVLFVPTTVFDVTGKQVVGIDGIFLNTNGDTPSGAADCYFLQGAGGICYVYNIRSTGMTKAYCHVRYTKTTD